MSCPPAIGAGSATGIGASEPGPEPRSVKQIVSELHALLTKIDVPPPYVLVGASFGGLDIQLFARRHPTEAAGVVLPGVRGVVLSGDRRG